MSLLRPRTARIVRIVQIVRIVRIQSWAIDVHFSARQQPCWCPDSSKSPVTNLVRIEICPVVRFGLAVRLSG